MKVFISWSGETSKAIAEILRRWLPSVIQAVRPYYTPDDITKGSRWNTEICKELEDCKVGLLCLTADNLEAPWIMFEAGALSKSLSSARVCPLLFGIDPSDIKGPLVQFQAAPFTKHDVNKTVRMMNQELGATALASDVLDSVFDMWWPKLEDDVKKVMSSVKPPVKRSVRSERDILEEVLERVRVGPSAPANDLLKLILAEISELRGDMRTSKRDTQSISRAAADSKELAELENLLGEARYRLGKGRSLKEIQAAGPLVNECRKRQSHIRYAIDELTANDRDRFGDLTRVLEQLERELFIVTSEHGKK